MKGKLMERTVLVVEDNPDWRKKFVRCFEGEGYFVQEAATYIKAMSLLQKQAYDVVTVDLKLVDWDMKDFSGMQLLNEIDKQADKHRTKAIIVTGYGQAEQVREAFKNHQVFDFIEKGRNFSLQEFKLVIREAMENEEHRF